MAVQAGPRAVVEDFYRRTNAGERDSALFFRPEVEWHWPPETPGASVFHGHEGIDVEHPVAHLVRVKEGLISAWWMFGDPEKARRRFLAGDRPG